MKFENGENRDTASPQPVPTEELAKFFGKKVRLPSKHKGLVVAIYHPEYQADYSSKAQLRVKVRDGSGKPAYHLVDACNVEIVDVLTVFAYQSKDGSIEWTSKNHTDQTLKRRGLKRLPNATKHIDLD